MKLRAFAIAACCIVMSVVQVDAQTVPLQRPPGLDLHALFSIVGRMYGLDPSLLEAVAIAESAEQPGAVSPKGAQGMMQLMPSTAERFGVVDPLDPVESVLGAARFLRYLGQIEGASAGALPNVLAAYNAGEHAVERHGGIPPFEETQDYVRKVLWLYLLQSVPASMPHRSPPHSKSAHHHRAEASSHEGAGAVTGDARLLQQLTAIRRARALAEQTQ